MQNKDAFKLLYNNLWLTKSELPEYLKLSSVTSDADGVTYNEPNIASNDPKKNIANDVEVISQLKSDVLNDTPVTKMLTQPEVVTQPQINKDLITSWDKLTDLINNCMDCKLCNTRKNLVIERGNRGGKWMFIGEAPGENEDVQGLPFVGSAGQLLDKMLGAMNLNPVEDVYICNTVKCRPPQNRNPEPEEINMCRNYLLSQINLVKPKIIVTLGRIAAHTLLKTTEATSKLRNQTHYINGNIPVIVTYHPAYLLRNPAAKKDTWEDLQFAMKTFATL